MKNKKQTIKAVNYYRKSTSNQPADAHIEEHQLVDCLLKAVDDFNKAVEVKRITK